MEPDQLSSDQTPYPDGIEAGKLDNSENSSSGSHSTADLDQQKKEILKQGKHADAVKPNALEGASNEDENAEKTNEISGSTITDSTVMQGNNNRAYFYSLNRENKDYSFIFDENELAKITVDFRLEDKTDLLKRFRTSRILFVTCPNQRFASAVIQRICFSSLFLENKKKKFYTDPSDFNGLIRLFDGAKTTKEEKPVLFVLSKQTSAEHENYWNQLTNKLSENDLNFLLAQKNVYIIHHVAGEDPPALLKNSFREYDTPRIKVDYLRNLLFEYFIGDSEKTNEAENYLNALILQNVVAKHDLYQTLPSVIEQKNLEEELQKIQQNLPINILRQGGEELNRVIENLQSENSVFIKKYQNKATDPTSLALIFIVSVFPGIGYSECDSLMKLLLPEKKETGSAGSIPVAKEYEEWISNPDEITKRCSINWTKSKDSHSGLEFIDDVSAQMITTDLHSRFPLYAVQKTNEILRSRFFFLSHSARLTDQIVWLLVRELERKDSESQLALLLHLLATSATECKTYHEKNYATALLARVFQLLLQRSLAEGMIARFFEVAASSEVNGELVIELLEFLSIETNFNVYPYFEHIVKYWESHHRYQVQRVIRSLARQSGTKCRSVITHLYDWLPSYHANKRSIDKSERFSLLFLGGLLPEFLRGSTSSPGAWPSKHKLFADIPEDAAETRNFFRIILRWLFHPLLTNAIWNGSVEDREKDRIDQFAEQLMDQKSYPDLIRSYDGSPDTQAIISLLWNSGIPLLIGGAKLSDVDKKSPEFRSLARQMSGIVRHLLLTMELADIIASWFVIVLGNVPSHAHLEAKRTWAIFLDELVTHCSESAEKVSVEMSGQGSIVVQDWKTESVLLWHWNNYVIWDMHRNGVKRNHARELRLRFLQQKEKVMTNNRRKNKM